VTCVWEQQRSRAEPPPAATFTIVPDACTDIVWTGSELRVAGPDTRPMVERLAPGPFVVGVRFHAGAGGSVLGAPLAALCDARVELRALWGDGAAHLADALRGRTEAEALALMQRAVLERQGRWLPLDPLVTALIAALGRDLGDPELRMKRVAGELGLSERQLQRRCVAAVGYAPKLLARILRMQRFREALRSTPSRPLSALAFELGFADQAHLSHESTRLFAKTPTQLRTEALRASASDFDKTSRGAMIQAASYDQAPYPPRAAR
jgi:AraC-like DNA-binding protein